MSARKAILEDLPKRETFLHQAAAKGTDKAMRKACKKLASAMKKGTSAVSEALRSWDANGCTPLHLLVKQGNSEGLSLLLTTISVGEASAKSQVSLKDVLDLPQEVSGDTALHIAVESRFAECVDKLLTSGATVNARNRSEKTALMLAVAHCDLAMVRTLLAHSADLNLPDVTGKSPLHVVAQSGDVELLRVLLKAGALVNWTTHDNTTALHLAAKMNRVEVIRELLEVGAQVNCEGPRNRTALHLAVCGSSMPTVRLLLEAEADVDAQDADGCTCLHLAAEHSTVECVRLLLEHGADLAMCDGHGRVPLHRAAQEGRLEVCQVLLQEGEQLLDARDSTRHTPLHLAMANGKAELCSLLIDRGADLRATNHAGQTPLHLAAAAGCPTELVRKMLQHGADPTQLDAAAHSPAFYALQLRLVPMAATLLLMPHESFESVGPDGSTPLHQAARLGLVDAAQQLVQQNRLPPSSFLDAVDAEGRTPLLLACKRASAPLVELLVSKGASVNAPAKNGDTCLMAGLRSQCVELLRVLLEANAELSRDQLAEHASALHFALLHDQAAMAELILIHTKDNARKHMADSKGRTPIMLAAHSHNQSCLNWLVKAGEAFVRAPDHAGRTALHYACATLDEDVPAVLSLLKHGADVKAQDNEGATALHVVAELNHLAVANLLLAENADLDVLTRDGFTPLHCAASNGHTGMTELLVDSGASILAAEPLMLTPLHLAAAGHPHCLEPLLGKACQQRQQHHQQAVLSSGGGSAPATPFSSSLVQDALNAADSTGDRAVHKAAAAGDASSLELLAAAGAELQHCTRTLGENLLHLAASSGVAECVRVALRLLGASVEKRAQIVNSRDLALRTPLHRALGADACALLLEAGADSSLVDHDQRSVLHCAAALSSGDHVRLLLARLDPESALLARAASGRIPLHFAAAHGNCETLLALLRAADQTESSPSPLRSKQLAAQDLKKRTALHTAAAAGHVQAALLLVESGADPALPDVDGCTALHLAVANQEEEVTAALLACPAVAAHVNHKDSHGQTCLHLAAGTGSPRVITLLADAGANLHSCTLLGNSPLHLAASLGRLATAHALLRLGVPADIGTYTDLPNTATPLLLAAGNGHRSLVRLLLKAGSSPARHCDGGVTALHAAAAGGQLACCKLLVRQGAARLDAVDRVGRTPLHLAAQNGHDLVAKYLAQRNLALLKVKDKAGLTPLQLAVAKAHNDAVRELIKVADTGVASAFSPSGREDALSMRPIHYAAAAGLQRAVAEHIAQSAADVNAVDAGGRTPLHWAVSSGSLQTVSLLLDSGANADAADHRGWTPLHISALRNEFPSFRTLAHRCAKAGRVALDGEGNTPMRLMLLHGSDESAEVAAGVLCPEELANDLDSQQNNLMHLAVRLDNPRLVERLLQCGVSAHQANAAGEDPLSIAVAFSTPAVWRALLGAKALAPPSSATSAPKHKPARTALHVAAALGKVDRLESLLDAGWPTDVRSASGETAATVAASLHQPETLRILHARGSPPPE